MDQHHGESIYMEARRSHSYDESFLYYNEQQRQQQQHHHPQPTSALYRPFHTTGLPQQREGPPLTISRDDMALGTTVLSPLGRFRAQYEQQKQGRPFVPMVTPPDNDTDSVPFDQRMDDRVQKSHVYQHYMLSDRSAKPFDEISQEPMEDYQKPVIQSRVHGPHRSEAQETDFHQPPNHPVDPRFRLPPVRVSKPALDAGVEDEEGLQDEQHVYDSEPPSLKRITKQELHDLNLSPGSGKVSTLAHPPESPMHARMQGIEDAYEEFGNASIRGNTTEEDDSLFDFGEKQRQKHQAGRRNFKKKTLPSTGDETSEDGCVNEPSTSLALRSQEAWKRKSARQPKNKVDEAQHVSFSSNTPSVHRYNDTYTTEASTLGGASLNSEYTKSMESEVEDAIKDIFLIGTGTGNQPGRRKLKYRPDMRRRLRWEKTHPDDDTLESEDEPTGVKTEKRIVVHGAPPAKSASNGKQGNEDSRAIIRNITPREEKKEAEGDALLGAWNMVETGLQAVGAAFGIDAGDDETAATFDDSSRGQGYDSETIDTEQPKPTTRPSRKSRTSHRSSIEESYDSSGGQSRSSVKVKSPVPADSTFLDYWSDAILGNSRPTFDNDPSGKEAPGNGEEGKRSKQIVGTSPKTSLISSPKNGEKQGKVLPSLDKDLRLIELAVESARSFHKLRGLVYDESDVDIVADIKFIVADLQLPLGLIFQENDSGCWVTKVLTDGSAIKKSIQVGDQLAAIDGKSAIRLNVEDIAIAIRQKKSKPFELTFLRYIGPIRAAAGATVEEEGYEIKARLAAAEAEHTTKGRKHRKQKPKMVNGEAAANMEQTPEDSHLKDRRRFRLFGRKNR